jgi:hypothetical protein
VRHKILGIRVVPLLGGVTVLYIAGAFLVGITSTDWRRGDTFSAIAGGVFFVISMLFAYALDERATDTQRLLSNQEKMLVRQQEMLEKVGVKLEVDLTTEAGLPSSLPDELPRLTWGERITMGLVRLGLGRKGRRALEVAIETGAAESVVRERFEQCDIILVLGSPARGVAGQLGRESDILHFTVDAPEGGEVVYLPVFTRFSAIAHARQRNPDWRNLSVLGPDGKQLLTNIDPEVTVVINPWEIPLLEYHPLSSERAPKAD